MSATLFIYTAKGAEKGGVIRRNDNDRKANITLFPLRFEENTILGEQALVQYLRRRSHVSITLRYL